MIRGLFRSARVAKEPSEYQMLLKSKREVQLNEYLRVEPGQDLKALLKKPWTRKRYGAPLQPLVYKLQSLPENHDPLVPLGNVAHLPFFVERTKSHNLPVYSEYRFGRTQPYTAVRRITGDVDALMSELSKITSNAKVSAHVGRLRISGLHTDVVSDYLLRLGF